MEIAIFDSVVVESALTELEAEGKKYDGLYVDMENAPERKYVKDKASLIATLKKKVERVRIDSAKSYKAEVEKQAAAIHERLDAANANFQVLIDDYTAERKKVLDAEKARKQAILDAEQFEQDHEMALLINKTFEYDRQQELVKERQAELARQAEREEYAAQQVKLAEERQIAQQRQAEQDEINAENARLANVEHVKVINNAALADRVELGLTENNAKAVISAIAKQLISNIQINY